MADGQFRQFIDDAFATTLTKPDLGLYGFKSISSPCAAINLFVFQNDTPLITHASQPISRSTSLLLPSHENSPQKPSLIQVQILGH